MKLTLLLFLGIFCFSSQSPLNTRDSGVVIRVVDTDEFNPSLIRSGGGIPGSRLATEDDGIQHHTLLISNPGVAPDLEHILREARAQNIDIFRDVDTIEEVIPVNEGGRYAKREADYFDLERNSDILFGSEVILNPLYLSSFRKKRFRATNPYLG